MAILAKTKTDDLPLHEKLASDLLDAKQQHDSAIEAAHAAYAAEKEYALEAARSRIRMVDALRAQLEIESDQLCGVIEQATA